MILLSPHTPNLLMPVAAREWRAPSAAQQKDQFGNENQTRFRITGRLHDGHPKFRLWFDDRDDADAFMWSLIRHAIEGVPFPREDWSLVDEVWGDPTLTPWMYYAVDTVQFIVSTSASNQTWTSPADWDSAHNTVEVIAGGGAGAVENGGRTLHKTGGGGGGYSKVTNFSVATPGTTTATYRLSAAVSVSATSTTSSAGVDGSDAWFDGTTLGGSTVGAQAGKAGAAGSGSRNGGLGGAAASGTGTTKQSGGRGGNLTGASGNGSSGGGGAAGPTGSSGSPADGNAGTDSSATTANLTTAGGAGDGTAGGSGTGGGAGNQTGAKGTEWDASHGAGGSGGGISNNILNTRTSTGGDYGAGAGAVEMSVAGATSVSTASQALIVITYTPSGGGGAGTTYTQLERGIRGYLRGVTPGTLH